jgi:hypothetical protein
MDRLLWSRFHWLVIFALVFGYLTDEYGRSRIFFITMAIYSAIDELIPTDYRGWADLAISGSYWIGVAAASILSITLLTSEFLGSGVTWRYAFGAVLAIFILFLWRFMTPALYGPIGPSVSRPPSPGDPARTGSIIGPSGHQKRSIPTRLTLTTTAVSSPLPHPSWRRTPPTATKSKSQNNHTLPTRSCTSPPLYTITKATLFRYDHVPQSDSYSLSYVAQVYGSKTV